MKLIAKKSEIHSKSSVNCRKTLNWYAFDIKNLKWWFHFYFKLQNKNSDFCAPLTSFDWNEVDPNLLGTSSIDTTCTIWGLEVCVICEAFICNHLCRCLLHSSEISYTFKSLLYMNFTLKSTHQFFWCHRLLLFGCDRLPLFTSLFGCFYTDWAGTGSCECCFWSREDPADCPWQGGVWHRLQSGWGREGHVRQCG